MPVEIPLTRGYVALVDEADAERVLTHSWRVNLPNKLIAYAVSSWHKDDPRTGSISLHRFVLRLTAGDPMVDHRDGNGLNNQRANLRLATIHENCMNRCIERAKRRNRHGFLGVSYVSEHGTYRGHLTIKGVRLVTKRFGTPIEAAIARDALALKHYGEFATLNFPDLRAAA